MLILYDRLGVTSAGRVALTSIRQRLEPLNTLWGVGSDTVYGFKEEALMSIPVDKTHLRGRA